SFSELWQILVNATQDKNAGEIICLLDAIDECEDEGRGRLARELCRLYGTDGIAKNFNLKFLLTSRPFDEIRRDFQPLEISGLPEIHLSGESEVEIKKISREIDVFIKAKVHHIAARLRLTHEEQGLLLGQLMRVPHRTYLWVYLTLNLIEGDIDKTEVVEVASRFRKTVHGAASQLPATVDAAYDRILSKSRNPEEAKKILHIVVAAARPLTVKEMTLALALRESHRSYDVINLEPEDRFRGNVRDICGLLVTIIDSRIYLLHQTAKEFLVRNASQGIHRDLSWKHSLRLQESHRILAEICTWHLLFAKFETHPLDEDGPLSQYLEDHVFLDYSAKHWAAHLRESPVKVQQAMTQLTLKICDTKS
ncbi:hypothetical protein QBC37DRAFT_239001, partial [Rhypophila decipiens]